MVQVFSDFDPDPNKSYEKNLCDYFNKSQAFFANNLEKSIFINKIMKNPHPEFKEASIDFKRQYVESCSNTFKRILENTSLHHDISQDIAVEIFFMAIRHVHMFHGFADWDYSKNAEEEMAKGSKIFNETIKILLYGALPRE